MPLAIFRVARDPVAVTDQSAGLAVRWRPRFGIILAVASFLIYAATVFALPQVRDNSYPCERSSIAAAVTNVVYGQRLGTVYWGLLDLYLKNFDVPLEQLLSDTPGLGSAHPTPPAGYLMKTTEDGNGVGYLVVATTAFRVFGLHAWALPLTMLILMALSGALFLGRHSGALAAVVTMYFSALTVMLFTPLMTVPAYAINIPVAGIRYFSLLTVLPAIHILLDTHRHVTDATSGATTADPHAGGSGGHPRDGHSRARQHDCGDRGDRRSGVHCRLAASRRSQPIAATPPQGDSDGVYCARDARRDRLMGARQLYQAGPVRHGHLAPHHLEPRRRPGISLPRREGDVPVREIRPGRNSAWHARPEWPLHVARLCHRASHSN